MKIVGVTENCGRHRFSAKIVGVTGLGVLWALEWAWHTRVTNLRASSLRNLNLRSPFSNLDSFLDIRVFNSFRDVHVHIYDF